MRSIAAFIIRASSFVSKELVEILRQTRLLLALVLGPFLILLLFGIGYRNGGLNIIPPLSKPFGIWQRGDRGKLAGKLLLH